MSNGYNHNPNCDCSFCKKGKVVFIRQRQRQLLPGDQDSACYPSFREVVSHTPNSTCPVCCEPVFYYRNDWGSSVFFDHLGPPWPKHPCTDSSRPIPFANSKLLPKNNPAIDDGWVNAELIDAIFHEDLICEFHCSLVEGDKIVLYVSSSYVENIANIQFLSQESICFLKPVSSDVFKISLLSDDLKVLNSYAYRNKEDALKGNR